MKWKSTSWRALMIAPDRAGRCRGDVLSGIPIHRPRPAPPDSDRHHGSISGSCASGPSVHYSPSRPSAHPFPGRVGLRGGSPMNSRDGYRCAAVDSQGSTAPSRCTRRAAREQQASRLELVEKCYPRPFPYSPSTSRLAGYFTLAGQWMQEHLGFVLMADRQMNHP